VSGSLNTRATLAGASASLAKALGLVGPGHDVDALAAEFVDHGLHARALEADAGADRIDGVVLARRRRSWCGCRLRATRP
jgi:hypothetical protein